MGHSFTGNLLSEWVATMVWLSSSASSEGKKNDKFTLSGSMTDTSWKPQPAKPWLAKLQDKN